MLPKIAHRILKTKLPSTGREVKYRPMQAREDKILLTAKAGGGDEEIFEAVSQVVNNVVIDEDFDIEKAPIFDIEWLFVQTRIASVGSDSDVAYIDPSDSQRYDFTVDLLKVEVTKPTASATVKVTEDVGIQLKWPSARDMLRPEITEASDEEAAARLIPKTLAKVFEGDTVHEMGSYTAEEIDQFIDQLPLDAFQKMMDYLLDIPRLSYTIDYTNSKGEERKIVLKNLQDFFMF